MITAIVTEGPLDKPNGRHFVRVLGPSDSVGMFKCRKASGEVIEADSQHIRLEWMKPIEPEGNAS